MPWKMVNGLDDVNQQELLNDMNTHAKALYERIHHVYHRDIHLPQTVLLEGLQALEQPLKRFAFKKLSDLYAEHLHKKHIYVFKGDYFKRIDQMFYTKYKDLSSLEGPWLVREDFTQELKLSQQNMSLLHSKVDTRYMKLDVHDVVSTFNLKGYNLEEGNKLYGCKRYTVDGGYKGIPYSQNIRVKVVFNQNNSEPAVFTQRVFHVNDKYFKTYYGKKLIFEERYPDDCVFWGEGLPRYSLYAYVKKHFDDYKCETVLTPLTYRYYAFSFGGNISL